MGDAGAAFIGLVLLAGFVFAVAWVYTTWRRSTNVWQQEVYANDSEFGIALQRGKQRQIVSATGDDGKTFDIVKSDDPDWDGKVLLLHSEAQYRLKALNGGT